MKKSKGGINSQRKTPPQVYYLVACFQVGGEVGFVFFFFFCRAQSFHEPSDLFFILFITCVGRRVSWRFKGGFWVR